MQQPSALPLTSTSASTRCRPLTTADIVATGTALYDTLPAPVAPAAPAAHAARTAPAQPSPHPAAPRPAPPQPDKKLVATWERLLWDDTAGASTSRHFQYAAPAAADWIRLRADLDRQATEAVRNPLLRSEILSRLSGVTPRTWPHVLLPEQTPPLPARAELDKLADAWRTARLEWDVALDTVVALLPSDQAELVKGASATDWPRLSAEAKIPYVHVPGGLTAQEVHAITGGREPRNQTPTQKAELAAALQKRAAENAAVDGLPNDLFLALDALLMLVGPASMFEVPAIADAQKVVLDCTAAAAYGPIDAILGDPSSYWPRGTRTTPTRFGPFAAGWYVQEQLAAYLSLAVADLTSAGDLVEPSLLRAFHMAQDRTTILNASIFSGAAGQGQAVFVSVTGWKDRGPGGRAEGKDRGTGGQAQGGKGRGKGRGTGGQAQGKGGKGQR